MDGKAGVFCFEVCELLDVSIIVVVQFLFILSFFHHSNSTVSIFLKQKERKKVAVLLFNDASWFIWLKNSCSKERSCESRRQ